MIRFTLALAILAGSWLFGLSYFHAPDYLTWTILISAGALLLCGSLERLPRMWESVIAIILLLPVAYLAPAPYKSIPILLIVGLVFNLAPFPVRWPWLLASGAIAAGVILLVQSLAFLFYESRTARNHDLPPLAAQLLEPIARALDIDAAVVGTTLTTSSMRKTHPFGATWELLIDPATFAFLIAGPVFLTLRSWSRHDALLRWHGLWAQIALFITAVVLWLPIRVGLHLALYMHRVLRTDFDSPLRVMNQFFSNSFQLLLVIGASLLTWRLFSLSPITVDTSPLPFAPAYSLPQMTVTWWRRIATTGLAALAIALLTFGLYWDPVGSRKTGRVLVDEFHSKWEPTDRPMDTSWYGHLSGYNYACMYDHWSRFYEMGRLKTPINDAALKNCDVLVCKVPTSSYAPAEIDAIEKFVEAGGGLLLVGEHTDVFGTGTHLNDIARRYNFQFRSDCLFGIDSVFEQTYQLPLIPHPILQRMPMMDFAVSCSIEPKGQAGNVIIRGTALKNMPADYHASNFYPQVEDRPESRYGAFVQLLAMRSGEGRVAAFTDSTIWSNFAYFEPGKSELSVGLIEWLNHRDARDLNWILILIGIAAAIASLAAGFGWDSGWIVIISAGLLAWGGSAAGIRAIHDRSMPAPKAVRPMVQISVDRTTSEALLPKGGFIAGKPEGFGIFERWILRLGYFTSRRGGLDAIQGDMVLYLHPSLPVPLDYRRKLIEYVENGGRILIVDSAENSKSTANTLLRPFDMSVDHQTNHSGDMTAAGYPTINVAGACEIKGGQPFAYLNGRPVGATARFGKGTVTAIGFGVRFNDLNMGVTGDVVPDQKLREVYEVQYRLFRSLIEGPAATQAATTQPLKIETDNDRK
jgi:hypothetical protein